MGGGGRHPRERQWSDRSVITHGPLRKEKTNRFPSKTAKMAVGGTHVYGRDGATSAPRFFPWECCCCISPVFLIAAIESRCDAHILPRGPDHRAVVFSLCLSPPRATDHLSALPTHILLCHVWDCVCVCVCVCVRVCMRCCFIDVNGVTVGVVVNGGIVGVVRSCAECVCLVLFHRCYWRQVLSLMRFVCIVLLSVSLCV